jgi:signal-transduction protein with cAMP-binding, CBS, and nucleotidyltransferase domain
MMQHLRHSLANVLKLFDPQPGIMASAPCGVLCRWHASRQRGRARLRFPIDPLRERSAPMTTVGSLLDAKGRDLWSIAPDASVYEAIELMAAKNIGVLLVLEEQTLVGVVSERDYARKIILQGRSSKDTQVKEIMTEKVFCVERTHTLEQCMALMTERRVRHLPVLQDNRPIGVISVGDVIKSIISEKQVLIDQLESYISGR